MAYTPQVWTNSPSTASPLSAARLNTLEAGVGDASDRIDAVETKPIVATDTTGAAVGQVVAIAAVSGGVPTGFGLVDTSVFNVKLYGATGDGTTDDTAAIQAAINACQAGRGGVVYLPAGRYKVTSSLVVTGAITEDPDGKAGVTIRGAGARATTVCTDVGITIFSFPLVTGGKWHLGLEEMALDGPGKAVTGSRAWFWDNVENCSIFRNLWIRDFAVAVDYYDSTQGLWENVNIRLCGTGLRTGWNHDIWTFLSCRFDRCDTAIQIGQPGGAHTGVVQETSCVIFQNCRIGNNVQRAVWVNDNSATGLVFDACYFESNPQEFLIGLSGRDDGAAGPSIELRSCYWTQPGNEITPPIALGFDVYNAANLRFVACNTDAAGKYAVFVRLADRRAGVTFEKSRISAATADVQWSGRSWKIGGGSQPDNLLAIGRRWAYHGDGGFQPDRWFDYGLTNYNDKIYAAWTGRQSADLAILTEMQIRDVGGVLRLDGITSAFIAATSLATLPTAAAKYRGCIAYVAGNGTTTADISYICLMSATGTYSWKQLVAG